MRIILNHVSVELAAPVQFVPGYRLDRYELLCPIAQGGMAAVWLARLQGKHGFEKLLAIKTILPSYAEDPRFRRMFLDEATIASRIEHANVAQILDLGEHEGCLYLVMDWVDGESVARLERAVHKANTVIPVGIVLRIMAEVCAGLEAAHDLTDANGRGLNVVHCDVSPQNILVTPKGAIKVIDFGIAKARDRTHEHTNPGTFKGKIHYMAPEQALGKPLDRRADVWAVGAVLYRLLAQRPVYDSDNPHATLHRLTSSEPPPALPGHFPRLLAGVVAQALAHDPSERYPSCAALKNALERVMTIERLVATPADVGAFVGKHLGGRLETRKKTIADALAAANEPPTLPRSTLPPEFLLEGSVTGTPARLEPRAASERALSSPPGDGSVTNGTTSLDARASLRAPPKQTWLGIGVALAAGVALLGGFAAWRAASEQAAASSAVPAVTSASTPAPAPSIIATTIPSSTAPSATPPANEEPPALDVSALPLMKEPPARSTKPMYRGTTKRAPPARTKPQRKVVDDGF